MSKHADLTKKVRQLMSGAPIGTIERVSGNYGRDQQGRVYFIESVEQREIRERIGRQKREGRKEKFVFNVMDKMPYVGDVLTSAQCGYLLVLSTYVDYDGLIVTSERNGEAMSRNHMLSVLGLKESQRSTLSEFINACLCYGIMKETDDGLVISSAIHTKGKVSTPNVVRSYVTRLRDMARTNKPEHIGFLYKLIPHIHKHSNILCENPNEDIPSKRGKLNRKQIAEATGVSVGYVSRLTSTMTYNSRSVFAKITTATEGTFYMLNPQIFRRADRVYDDTTREIFGLYDKR